MDFCTILQTAKQNEQSKKESRSYCTKFSPPKREEKKAKSLSVNIQKFLARKEAEEKNKQMEAKKKRDDLLALRAQDKKASRRVNVMLKRTKSANQSVLADAVNTVNTAVTMAGPSQPDEDDYGYVSQEASAYYEKMMEKYSKMPDDPKFANMDRRKVTGGSLASTKDRVRAALEREREEANMPHRRKRKRVEGDEGKKEEEEEEREEIEVEQKPQQSKPKPKVAPPPALSFGDLLKLAEKKQHEPIMIEVKPKDDTVPLTKKQKKEQERVEQWKTNKKLKESRNSSEPISNGRIPKLSESDAKSSKTNHIVNGANTVNTPEFKRPLNIDKKKINNQQEKPPVSNHKVTTPNITSKFASEKPTRPELTAPTKKINGISSYPRNQTPTKKPTSQFPTNTKKPPVPLGNQPNTQTLGTKSKQCPPSNAKPKQFPPLDVKPKQFPPSDIKPKQYSPPDVRPKPLDVRPKQLPLPDVMRRPISSSSVKNKKRMVIDSDEEYDSEMDDFIDDGPLEDEDYSKHIKEIFGYDKSKYRGELYDDVDCMESTFAQQMKEDARSTKIGLMEDLEDIRREKEEKRRKAIKMKGTK